MTTPYLRVNDLLRPLQGVAMPRAMRVHAPGGTIHAVARCNIREFYFTTAEDFAVLLAHLGEVRRTYEITLYAYTLMANHIHLLLQAPTRDALGRPLRWFMTETAKAFHRASGRHRLVSVPPEIQAVGEWKVSSTFHEVRYLLRGSSTLRASGPRPRS